MKNPLVKRLPRELKSEAGKYIVLFIFIAGMIGIVSGFLVASGSMSKAYDESFEKYNIEDGNFELYEEASDDVIDTLEKEDVKIYENYYIEEETKEVDSTLRIFKNRKDIDKVCIMEGELPEADDETAIDRMYAVNNELSVGDTITAGKKKLKITGFVALSDYSALYESPADMMFDSVQFGVAIVTDKCFDEFGTNHIHYSYSWKYDNAPENDREAREMSEDFLKVISENAIVTNYIPQYSNQAIHFTGDDIKGDNSMITVFLYIVVIIIAFIFAITSNNTISKESSVIGTLRASGYSKGELVRHYMTMPVIITLIAALAGNILGYTFLKDFAVAAYYGSYSLPTYVTIWNADAFVKTTIIPVIIMLLINFFVLTSKMNLSPLKFLRHDLSRKQKKKAFRLNTKIGIMKRFRLRIIFQNIPNYVTIFIGIFFANVILFFGMALEPLLDNYQNVISDNMICSYQYILKAPQETDTKDAEKFCAGSLKTIEGRLKSEEVTIYGAKDDSKYIKADLSGGKVYISSAYAEKFDISAGDTITLKEEYGDKEYKFKVEDIYDYPAAVSLFMSMDKFNDVFDNDEDYFNGYFSENEIDDIDDMYIAASITVDDMTKVSRQLKVSMGNMMSIFLVFGIVMFMLIIYLLSKIIIEKNSQSISMTKILGYTSKEINNLYIMSTSIVVVLSVLITIPIIDVLMKYILKVAFSSYSGWLPYYVPTSVYIKTIVMGIVSYAVIAFILMQKVKKIPMDMALKNVE